MPVVNLQIEMQNSESAFLWKPPFSNLWSVMGVDVMLLSLSLSPLYHVNILLSPAGTLGAGTVTLSDWGVLVGLWFQWPVCYTFTVCIKLTWFCLIFGVFSFRWPSNSLLLLSERRCWARGWQISDWGLNRDFSPSSSPLDDTAWSTSWRLSLDFSQQSNYF